MVFVPWGQGTTDGGTGKSVGNWRPLAFNDPRIGITVAVMRVPLKLLLFVVCSLLGSSTPVGATPLPHSTAPLPAVSDLLERGPVPFALTVSGGVSLGAYEAGFLYYYIEMFKQYPAIALMKAAGGASAGSLNALLSIMAYCTEEMPPPQDSLFWRVWVPLGFGALFQANRSSALGLFERDRLELAAQEIEAVWRQGLSNRCDMVWGVAVTRLFPRNISLADSRLELPRLEEKFTLRIRGRGPGVPPSVSNYVGVQRGLDQTMLVADGNNEVAFDDMRDLTLASCSFPVAFSPMGLRYCITHATGDRAPVCRQSNASKGFFIDGGVLDNSPLRLMARTVAGGLRVSGGKDYVWADTPHGDDDPAAQERARFLFVSPDAADYPIYDALGRETEPGSTLDLLKQIAATFVGTARTKELYTLLEERPELRDRIMLPRRHFPTASGLLSAFFGFFEQDFRIFDFYLGMYDARRVFDEDILPRINGAIGDALSDPVYPEEQGMGTSLHLEQWLPLMCMRAVFDGQPDLLYACEGDPLSNFRVLTQVSLERLYDNCARLDAQQLPKTHSRACLSGAAGGIPMRMPGVVHPKDFSWRRDQDESELEYLLRLLASHHFSFDDLGLGSKGGTAALTRIRYIIGQAASELKNKQPLSERSLLQLGAEFLVDYVAYAPPLHSYYALVSRTTEFGMSHTVLPAKHYLPALRIDSTLMFDGLFSFLTASRDHLAMGPSVGLELMPNRLGSRFLQWRAIGRAGYMFAQGDGWTSGPCRPEHSNSFGGCSRPRLEAVLGLTAFEHIRFQLALSWYLSPHKGTPHLWAVGPGVGLQF